MQIKRIIIFIALLALLVAGCSGANAPASTSPTPTLPPASDAVFKTPDDAIQHYFEGLAQNDVHKILEACAVNEMSEKFKFDLYTDRLQYLIPIQSESPAEYPFYAELNKPQITSQILMRVKIFAYSLLSGEEVDTGKAIKMDAAGTSKFMKDVDPKKLSNLKVEKIAPPNKTLMNDAKYLENADKIAKIYGADESTERVALFLFDQNEYYLGFTLLRYGDNWKISAQTSPLANTNPVGSPTKTTAAEFENMTNP